MMNTEKKVPHRQYQLRFGIPTLDRPRCSVELKQKRQQRQLWWPNNCKLIANCE